MANLDKDALASDLQHCANLLFGMASLISEFPRVDDKGQRLHMVDAVESGVMAVQWMLERLAEKIDAPAQKSFSI